MCVPASKMTVAPKGVFGVPFKLTRRPGTLNELCMCGSHYAKEGKGKIFS